MVLGIHGKKRTVFPVKEVFQMGLKGITRIPEKRDKGVMSDISTE